MRRPGLEFGRVSVRTRKGDEPLIDYVPSLEEDHKQTKFETQVGYYKHYTTDGGLLSYSL